jgi:hypothetical protein
MELSRRSIVDRVHAPFLISWLRSSFRLRVSISSLIALRPEHRSVEGP